ncbi:tRNA (adenosine(37)-N6)-threonylcarbamoyltransferase complex ATPase subunit type 1 TsaE, partial [Flavobacteriaceae bacterium]|nr:tRNA (adenosine(37)-N6)-threonylcarbamoyltransferase complex ATPase subunit type 1 TsaE [Flavobacteriaceae bacterium]
MRQSFTLENLGALAKEIKSKLKHTVLVFEGSMGVGKTTLIHALCKELEILDTVSSPTFSLINEYKTKNGKSIYHFDCYRLETEEEAFDFGAEEYIDSGSLCLIEWPDRISSLLPSKYHR